MRFAQVPTEPERSHASQAPPQAVSQQTPSTQLPEVHSLAVAQALPFASFGTQLLAEQYEVAMHFASTVQVAGQLTAAPEQR